MDDPYKDFPKEFPRVWFVAGIWLAAILLVATMLLYTSTRAHAQALCAPAEAFIRQTVEVQKQKPVWEGTISVEGGPPAEALILASDHGTWSFFIVQSGRACMMASGTDATPIDLGRGI